MKLRLSHLSVLLVLGTFSFFGEGCITPPNYPIEPKIEFMSFSKTDVYRQLDSVYLTFSFTDGDGDIGFASYDSSDCFHCDESCLEDDTLSIFIFDNRTGCLVPYNVPYVPPKGSSEAISGKIQVLIYPICCIYPDKTACYVSTQTPRDTVLYSVQLKDRAGNLSNRLQLPPVILHCDGQ